MKTNIKKLRHICSTSLSAFLVLAVFLTSAHAKDLASSPMIKSKVSFLDDQTTKRADDPVTKSIGDLHSHVDKTMVKDPGLQKSMAKSFADTNSLAARREREEGEDDQSLSVKLIEMMFMARLTLAYALAH